MPETESTVVRVMREHKEALVRREESQMRNMAKEWLKVENALDTQITGLAETLQKQRDAGGITTLSKVYEMQRAQELLGQLRNEMGNYADYASREISSGQREMIQQGIAHANEAVKVQLPGFGGFFDMLPTEAVEHMVGLAGDGSPLRDLVYKAWPDAGEAMLNNLVKSVALGINPRQTVRNMKDELAGVALNRALAVARTEQIRAYREAGYEQYANSGLVEGFYRLAAHNARTCIACLVAEGEFYDMRTGERLKDHTRGRCTMIPQVKGMKPPQWTKGEEWLKQQDPSVQRDIMGPGRYDAWQSGKVQLRDMAVTHKNATWGDSVHAASLKDLLSGKAKYTPPIRYDGGTASSIKASKKPRKPTGGEGPSQATSPNVEQAPQTWREAAARRATIQNEARVLRNEVVRHKMGSPEEQEAIKKLNEFNEANKKQLKALDKLVRTMPNTPAAAEARKRFGQLDNDLSEGKITRSQYEAELQRLLSSGKAIPEDRFTTFNGKPLGPMARKGLAFFRDLVDNDVLDEGYKVVTTTENDPNFRAYAMRAGTPGAASIHIGTLSNAKTMAHELGHTLEYGSAGAYDRAAQFLKDRAGGAPLESLRSITGSQSYGKDEVAWKDQFKDAYTGRYYKDATEVISMGVQYMFDNPVRFAQQDPGHFELIWSVIRP